jgi:hypothetical protein
MLHNASPRNGPRAREEVARDYDTALAELTFNSKPIINALTMIAEENIAYAEEIVAVIENKIRTVGFFSFVLFFLNGLLFIFR